MSYVYWTITGQYSIINDPITGFVNTSRFTTLITIKLYKITASLWILEYNVYDTAVLTENDW